MVKLVNLLIKVLNQERKKSINLRLGPSPVFCGKGIDCQSLDPYAVRGANYLVQSIHSGAMAKAPGHMLCLCPATVAVHDYSDMLGQCSGKPKHAQLIVRISFVNAHKLHPKKDVNPHALLTLVKNSE